MTVDGIRFYEKSGLLPRVPRTAGRFRIYGDDALERVHFIRQMQSLGFSLREIRELVNLRAHKVEACEKMRKSLEERLTATRAKTRELRKLERELLADLRKCDEELKHRRGHKACACPVLEEAEE